MLNVDKYGFIISIVSFKCLFDSIVYNDINFLREFDMLNN